jgi:hypothetical protein
LSRTFPCWRGFDYFEWGGAGQILCANETNIETTCRTLSLMNLLTTPAPSACVPRQILEVRDNSLQVNERASYAPVHVTRPRLCSPLQPYLCPYPLPMNAHIDTAASAHLWDTGLRLLNSSFECRCSPTRPGSCCSNPFGCIHGFGDVDADATA